MTKSKWQRLIAAPLVAALLATSFAPAVLAADQAAVVQQTKASEITGMIPGGQFAKIWLELTPVTPGNVTVSAEWDRANPEDSGLGFYVLDEAGLTAVINGGALIDNNISAGSTTFFLNGPNNLQGAAFRATGTSYAVIIYNDSADDANFRMTVTNAILVDESDQVKAEGVVTEEATAAPEATETATEAAPAAEATETAEATATPVATAAPVAAPAVPAGPVRAQTMKGELPEQYDQHYLGLEPEVRDAEIKLTLTFDPQDSQELARRLNFWVLDDQGFRRYQAGENAGDVAVAAGNRADDNDVRSASFTSSGLGPYTVIVYNNSRVPATYELGVTGGTLVDDSLQTITAQESVTVTAPAAVAATGVTTPTATTTTTETTGRVGEPGGTYTVKSGDTLALIARDIYGDFRLYEQLCAFNNIADCNVIEVDQVIKLPTTEEIGATTPTTAAATPEATTVATEAATVEATATATVTATAAVTATAVTTATATSTPAATTAATGNSVASVAASNANFKILSAALTETGLDTTLAGAGEYTVFAPTDAAFNALLSQTNLTQAQLLQAKELADILRYHVLSGKVLSTDITDGLQATTLQGKPVNFEVKDGSVYINGAKVTITDIEASNGVIHAIDAVILPPAQ
ncbi:MAG: fasciclin domain-containing protein [Caldilineaceae bacterium]|nr:fasciclin domain-containing protein [Caldilineaceae bacterium]